MIFDSTLLAALTCGLNELRGARLRDLWQSSVDEGGNDRALTLIFNHAAHGDLVLHIDTSPQNARLHFVSRAVSQPENPTALTALLRKSLRGARFEGATQPNFDRILHLQFEARDAIGDSARFTLIAEIMDRRANAILLDENGIILDAVKRLPPFLNRARTILPHREYLPPPSQRQNPLLVTDWHVRVLAALHDENTTSSTNEKKRDFDGATWLRANFTGVSPLVVGDLRAHVSQVLATQDSISENAVATAWSEAFLSFFTRANAAARGEYSPHRCNGSQPYPFALEGGNCEISNIPARRNFFSDKNYSEEEQPLHNALHLSTLMETAAQSVTKTNAVDDARAALLSHLAARKKLNAAQANDVERALQHAAEAARFNLQGQMILSHVARVEEAARRGADYIELPDEYSQLAENEESARLIRISIEPKWSAADNASLYFARYRRAKKLGEGAPARREKLAAEAAELSSLEERTRQATTLEEIEKTAREGHAPSAALEDAGKNATSTRSETLSGRQASPQTAPQQALSRSKRDALAARPESKLRRRDLDGFVLYMGRNAVENQLLLSKVASPADMWMHVRGRPSAHVIVKGPKGKVPPPQVLHEAGLWVASAGGRVPTGEKIEIIYTQAKFVRAVRGAPGRVTLARFQTLLVEAREDRDAAGHQETG